MVARPRSELSCGLVSCEQEKYRRAFRFVLRSAAQWTGAHKGPAFFAYSDNYLIDVKFGVILDVEAFRAIRQAEVGAARTMIERTEERFGLKPARLVGDTAYGAAPMLNWLVEEKDIAPYSCYR